MEKKPLHLALDAATIVLVLFTWAYVLLHYAKLPEEIPVHFGAGGQPDDWGPKSAIFLVPGMGTVVLFFLFLLARWPMKINYTVRVTEENRAVVYQSGYTLIQWLKVLIAALFLVITLAMMYPEIGYLGAALMGLAVAPLLLIVWFFWRVRGKKS